MNSILDFLNSSEKDALAALPDCSAKLAEKIIASRPFSSLEDAAGVKGLTPELLSRWQSHVEAEESKAVSMAENAVDETPSPDQHELLSQPRKPRTLRILWTALLVILILAALAAAAYFGIPYFYERVLNPLESNTTRVSELIDTQKADTKRLEDEISALQTRVANLEVRAEDIEQSIASHSTTLAKLEEMQAALQANLDTQKSDILSQMDEQLTLTRSLELLARSRLYLSQSNFGLAQTDITEARALLYSMLPGISADQSDGLKVVISRLDLALGNLPQYPVVAVYDVDIAWKLLVDGLPNVPPLAVTPVITAPTSPAESPELQLTQVIETTPTP
jgi:hypothetical protein